MSTKIDSDAVAIDYETFYDSKSGYSLTGMSTLQYCRDQRFEPYLVAICGKDIFGGTRDSAGSFVTCDVKPCVAKKLDDGRELYVGRPEHFDHWNHLNGRILLAHNASFDSVVTDECMRRGIIPRLDDIEWQCTADLASYLLAPRNLKGAMKTLFGREISKAVRAGMDGRHDYELDPDDYAALIEYGGSDAIECHDIWLEYCGDWPLVERAISCQNRNAIADGVLIDRDYAERALKELKSYQSRVLCEIPWTSKINPKTHEFYKAGSLPALRQAVIDLGITPPKSFKKDDPGFLEWISDHEDDVPFIKPRQVAVALAMHIARIEGILDSLDENGKAHPSFLYFGAHTGRFSGKSDASGTNINMLNMPRKPVFSGDKNVFDGKGVDIRGMYVPRPGYKFAVYDYSQIEARFALWLVDDTHMMDALRTEGNLYQANAVAMGWCESRSDIKHKDPDKYRLAKCCLAGDTLVLVRTEKENGALTSPYYKSIIRVTLRDRVWDGHEWVRHLGVEKMKEVKESELIELGGVCLTRDHKVYVNDTESRRADEVLEGQEATAVSWGQSTSPVRGWAHVWILTTALARLSTRALYLATREALHLLASKMRVHRVRKGSDSVVGQRANGEDHAMCIMRSESRGEEPSENGVGEDA